jgi:uncharacterized protein YbaA (DUF1428 family)
MHFQIRHRSFNSRSLRKFGLVLVASAGLLAGRSVLAAEQPAAGTDLDALFRNYVEALRSDVKSGKVEIYSRVMQLNASEAKVFWPIYQQYETELFALGDRRLALIKKFADGYSKQTLDDPTAKTLTKEWFGLQEDRLKLWKKYQKRIEKSLTATRAAQFLQIESRINALIDLMIASEIPLIDPTRGARSGK